MTDEFEISYSTGGTLAADAKGIIDAARSAAYRSVNVALVRRNWLLGRRIAEEVLKGEGRAEYGKQVIMGLAVDLTAEYGKGFDFTNLYRFLEFYKTFQIFDTLCSKSGFVCLAKKSFAQKSRRRKLFTKRSWRMPRQNRSCKCEGATAIGKGSV